MTTESALLENQNTREFLDEEDEKNDMNKKIELSLNSKINLLHPPIIKNDSSKSKPKIENLIGNQNKIKTDKNINNLMEKEGEKYSGFFFKLSGRTK